MTVKIKQGLIVKSSDGEFVYNIFSYHPDSEKMTVDVLNRNLETIATRRWLVEDFQKQIDNGTIVSYRDDEWFGNPPDEQAE